jgi:hypothetical protein
MRKIFSIVFVLLSLITKAQWTDIDVQSGAFFYNTRPAIIYLPDDYSDSTSKYYPIVIFLHGSGEGSTTRNNTLLESTGLPQIINSGQVPKAVIGGITRKFIVVCPQWPANETVGIFSHADTWTFLLNNLKANYRIDPTRVYVTGLSLGAESTVSAGTWNASFAKGVAAVFPISFTGWLNQPPEQDSTVAMGKRYGVKLWTVVGSNDTNVGGVNPFALSQTLVNTYNSLTPSPLGIRTVITGGTHSASTWNVAYDTSYRPNGKNMYEWFYQYQADTTTPPNTELTGSKLPITTDYVWQDNSQQDKATKLVDGDTLVNYSPAPPIIYTQHDIVFDLWDWNATVSGVKMWIGNPDTTTVHVIVVRRSDNTETEIGTFSGGTFQHFVYRNTDSANVSSKIILRTTSSNYQFGSEVQVWGTYAAPTTPTPKVRRPLGWMSGTNSHSYDLMNDAKLNKLKTLNLANVRTWENAYDVTDASNNWKFEPELGTDRYSTDSAFSILRAWKPTLYTWKANTGQWTKQLNSWNVIDDFPNRFIKGTDSIYIDHGSWGEVWMRVTQVSQPTGYNITRWYVYKGGVLINITETPETFSSDLVGQMRHYNVGGSLGINPGDVLTFYKSQQSVNPIYLSALDLPMRDNDTSYTLDGQNAFVYASRGGINASVPTYPLQTTVPAQRELKGYHIYSAVEGANEPDAWWTSWLGFWNGKTVEHLQSMVYDGAKNVYANTGAKQADSTIDVLMSGMATDKTDQIYGAIEEARRTRGYKTDGSINVPFTAVNVHIYPSSSGQFGSNNGALPWELGGRPQVRSFINLIERRVPNTKFYITEWGYDLNVGSPLHAGSFSSYDRETVAAFWMTRAMLTMAADGVDRSTYYTLFQDWPESQSNNSTSQFATMRLLRQPIDSDANVITRSRQGDYMAQYNEFYNYTYADSLVTGSPYVHAYRYTKVDTSIIAIWSEESYSIVSDSTKFTERTGNVTIPVPSTTYKLRRFMDDGSATMSTQTLTSAGMVTFSYAAKPIIVQYTSGIIPNRKKRTITYY